MCEYDFITEYTAECTVFESKHRLNVTSSLFLVKGTNESNVSNGTNGSNETNGSNFSNDSNLSSGYQENVTMIRYGNCDIDVDECASSPCDVVVDGLPTSAACTDSTTVVPSGAPSACD